MTLLDGKKLSTQIKSEIKEKVLTRAAEGKKIPHLAAILVGENPASMAYVRNKVKSCEEVGFTSTLFKEPDTISENDLLHLVENLNNNPEIDGFIVQLPLPRHINEHLITLAIKAEKDVDGFHPRNLGNMILNLPGFLPATPAGIMELMRRNNIETEGKNCVILGRSNIVGTPLSIMLARNTNPGNCTVTLAHSKTKNIKALCREADILIAAIGKPNFVTADMVKEGAVIIDVGTTRVEDSTRERGWRLVGDVKFDEVAPKTSFISPVPGGVGPMTIASLMMNTLKAMELKAK
jgi:methylenetetrahydrofolate dehydrogenase (NADP+)/methenyltetrahydrofolate cyclohydrolase